MPAQSIASSFDGHRGSGKQSRARRSTGGITSRNPMAGEANALSTAQHVPRRRGRALTIDNRFLPPILITSILLGANLSFGILEGWERTALSIVVAIGTELIL